MTTTTKPPTVAQLRRQLTVEAVAEAVDVPPERWHGNCHAVSHALVMSQLIPGARVARGHTVGLGIGSQHSWVTLGNPYDRDAILIDPTAHRWANPLVGVHVAKVGTSAERGLMRWVPHGWGSIMEYGRPMSAVETNEPPMPVELDGEARQWWDMMLGPDHHLGRTGWAALLHAPAHDWPAAQIITAAIAQHRVLLAVIPIDPLGMLTELNPSGLYMHPDDQRRPDWYHDA